MLSLNGHQYDSGKDPTSEGPALIHSGRVMKVAATSCRSQVSGFRCQVSATEVDPLDGSTSRIGFPFTAGDFQPQPKQGFWTQDWFLLTPET